MQESYERQWKEEWDRQNDPDEPVGMKEVWKHPQFPGWHNFLSGRSIANKVDEQRIYKRDHLRALAECGVNRVCAEDFERGLLEPTIIDDALRKELSRCLSVEVRGPQREGDWGKVIGAAGSLREAAEWILDKAAVYMKTLNIPKNRYGMLVDMMASKPIITNSDIDKLRVARYYVEYEYWCNPTGGSFKGRMERDRADFLASGMHEAIAKAREAAPVETGTFSEMTITLKRVVE